MGRAKPYRMGITKGIKVPEAMAPKIQELVRVLDGRRDPMADLDILIKLLN